MRSSLSLLGMRPRQPRLPGFCTGVLWSCLPVLQAGCRWSRWCCIVGLVHVWLLATQSATTAVGSSSLLFGVALCRVFFFFWYVAFLLQALHVFVLSLNMEFGRVIRLMLCARQPVSLIRMATHLHKIDWQPIQRCALVCERR